MATTNYGWTLPTEGGDTGTWDTKLNAAFEEVDTELKRVEDDLDVTETAAFDAPRTLAAMEWFQPRSLSTDSDAFFPDASNRLQHIVGTASVQYVAYVPLKVQVGQTLTGFTARAYRHADMSTVTLQVGYFDQDGTFTTVGTTEAVSSGASLATVTKTGLSHTVVAGRVYAVAFSCAHAGAASAGETAYLASVLPTVTNP